MSESGLTECRYWQDESCKSFNPVNHGSDRKGGRIEGMRKRELNMRNLRERDVKMGILIEGMRSQIVTSKGKATPEGYQ